MLKTARNFTTALLTGAVMVSGAWAGASIVQVDETRVKTSDKAASVKAAPETQEPPAATPPAEEPQQAAASQPAPPPDPSSLHDGQVLAGAAKTSIRAAPRGLQRHLGEEPEKCSTLSENAFTQLMEDPAEMGDHLALDRLAVA